MKKTFQESMQEAVQKTWSEAITTFTSIEEEVGRRFRQLKERTEFAGGSEDLQRVFSELTKRLQKNSDLLEQRLEDSIRKVCVKVKQPLVEELTSLKSKAESLSKRIEWHLRRKNVEQEDQQGEEEAPTESDRVD